MKLHTFLYDLTDILGGFDFYALRIDDPCTFRAVSTDKRLVVYGKTREPIEFIDGICGLELDMLRSMLNAPGFNRLTMTCAVGTGKFGKFIELNGGAHRYNLPLWSEEATKTNIRVPPFKGAVFNISSTPTADGVQLLKYWRGKLRQEGEKDIHEPHFVLDIANGKLTAEHKLGGEKINFAVSDFCVGQPSQKHFRYSSASLIKLCELQAHTVSTLLQVSDMGAAKFEVETTHCHYQFLLPGRQV